MAESYPDLFYGYTALWLCLVVYIMYLGRKVRYLEDQAKKIDIAHDNSAD